MTQTLEALQKLVAESHVIRQRGALAPVSPEKACSRLSQAVRHLRQESSMVKLDRPRLDTERIWSRFAASGHDLKALDGLQFRALCNDDTFALRPIFISALIREPARLKRSPCLYGMVNCYFSGWREMENASTLENLLKSVFARDNGKNPVVQKWRAALPLFSERAAMFLAEEICGQMQPVDDLLRQYYVRPVTKLGLSVRALAARLACENLRKEENQRNHEWSLRYLQWMTSGVLSEMTLPDTFSDAVSYLILSESARRSEDFRRALQGYIQNHKNLGDPRSPDSALNWRSIHPEAARRYLSWLAHYNITFFFNTILPNSNENKKRKDFWLRYLDRIVDFQVAVSAADLWKVRASRKVSDLLNYSLVAHPTTSAFMMKFEGYGGQYLVVEFSETGNAAHIFRFSDFEAQGVTLRAPRFEWKQHLKFDGTQRIIHQGDWEPKAAYKLSSEFGIRP